MEVGMVNLINGRSLKVECVCVVNRSVPSSVGGFSQPRSSDRQPGDRRTETDRQRKADKDRQIETGRQRGGDRWQQSARNKEKIKLNNSADCSWNSQLDNLCSEAHFRRERVCVCVLVLLV